MKIAHELNQDTLDFHAVFLIENKENRDPINMFSESTRQPRNDLNSIVCNLGERC